MQIMDYKNIKILCNIFLCFCLISCKTSQADSTAVHSTYKVGDVLSFDSKLWGSDSIELHNLSQVGTPLLGRYALPITHQIPKEWAGDAIAIYSLHDHQEKKFQTYFRVVEEGQMLNYVIATDNYKSLPIYKLNGGMSPEFAVQKSLANLTGGVSHTWGIGPGGGPQPVWGTVDFLQRSIETTIDLYDKHLGKDAPIENVIIGTGVPAVSYLSAATKAVYLPIQYLVSVNSIKEIEGIINHSHQNGLPVYATLGYDASMSNVGVAWIKLLDLPKEYQEFIKRHKVKNVMITGVGENAFGESFVRKYIHSGNPNEEYADGSLYILYTQGGSEEDIKHITSYIKDYDTTQLDKGRMIADWESGIISKQVSRIGNTIKATTGAKAFSLVSPTDMGCFYNFAVDLSLAFMKKNVAQIPSMEMKGFYFNEYLIAQPFYEMLTGKAPILYWQFVPVKYTVDRMFNYGFSQSKKYFPNFNSSNISVSLNGRLFVDDMRAELEKRGVSSIEQRVKGIEEVWSLADGINAPCETVAKSIVEHIGVTNYQKLSKSAIPLSMEELAKIASEIDGVDWKVINP